MTEELSEIGIYFCKLEPRIPTQPSGISHHIEFVIEPLFLEYLHKKSKKAKNNLTIPKYKHILNLERWFGICLFNFL